MTYLAHHSLVEALPAVVPMVVLVGAFAAIVVADRRRAAREGGQDDPGADASRDQEQAR